MKNLLTLLPFLLPFFTPDAHAVPPATKLMLFGGGSHRPAAAMKVLAEWAGGEQAKVLIIGWSSTIPEDYFASISGELKNNDVSEFLPSLTVPQNEAEKAFFLKQLDEATAVFFTGGNQMKAMAAIERWNLAEALRQKFQSGTAFAGTSAGTALMADTMIMEDHTEKGLGIFPKAIIDMHFLRPGRESRLTTAMKATGVPYGIGIWEDGALSVINSEQTRVIGPAHVVFFHSEPAQMSRVELQDGQSFNAASWAANNCNAELQGPGVL